MKLYKMLFMSVVAMLAVHAHAQQVTSATQRGILFICDAGTLVQGLHIEFDQPVFLLINNTVLDGDFGEFTGNGSAVVDLFMDKSFPANTNGNVVCNPLIWVRSNGLGRPVVTSWWW